MKARIILILLLGILIGFGATYILLPHSESPTASATGEQKQLYSCGMHPEVISEEPGNCPICGMKLTPIKDTSSAAAVQPAGERRILYWQAPMDPTEIYDEPGKSKMGMDLVPVYEGDEAGGTGSITIDGTIRQNMNLRTAPVERRDISRLVRAHGRVTFAQDREFAVNAKIGGWVERLHVSTVGRSIRRGEPLLEIYSPELMTTQEEFLLALRSLRDLPEGAAETVRRSAERMLELARSRLDFWDISGAEIDDLERTGHVKRTVVLRARVSGVVTHKAVVQGDRIAPGQDLFHIADLKRIWVEASIYESELPFIRKGQRAELELDHLGAGPLKGTVDFIYPYLDGRSRANTIRLIFPNPDMMLKPEMYATVRIHGEGTADALAVPSEAVIHSGKREIVFVVRGEGTFEPREVRIGLESDDGHSEIVSGLLAGDRVVVSGQFLLDSESRTREAIAKLRAAKEKPPSSKAEPTHEHAQDEAPAHQHAESEPASRPASGIDPARLHICPMHPKFLTTDPDIRCPICEMKLIPLREYDGDVDLDKLDFYTCPMHPEFLTTDPDIRCPICEMKLEKVKKNSEPEKRVA